MTLGYQVVFHTIIVGVTPYSIRALKDGQQFYDPDDVCKDAGICDASWSLFGVIWPSSIMLADMMDSYAFAGLRVLEVGCGLGLASLVSHHHGADITASDYHPLAKVFLEENITGNTLLPIKYLRLDWQKIHGDLGQFDLIIGSDILYQPDHPAMLSGFIQRHLAHKGKVLIVDPGRRQRREFSKRMIANGFALIPHAINAELAEAIKFSGQVLEYQWQ